MGRHIDFIQEIIPKYNGDMDMLFANRTIYEIIFGYFDPVLADVAKLPFTGGLNPRYKGT